MADLLEYNYPSGTKEFCPVSKGGAQRSGIYRGMELPFTWAEIKTKITSGDMSNIYIGDYKQITLTTNETVIMEVAGINTYQSCGSSNIGDHIDFISRHCLATAYRFNATDTNNGTSAFHSVWQASELRVTLNDETTGVITTLPSDLRSAILPRYGWQENRYSSGGAVSADTGAGWGNCYSLWIPSEAEVFDHISWSEIGYGTAGYKQYPIFRLNPAKIVKLAGQGGSLRASWWTLSAQRNNSLNFCAVHETGYATYYTATHAGARVPLCFRIG